MKTYVITISERFPAKHYKAGWLTGFEFSISMDIKIHTIRGNYPLWKKRFEEIEKGNACLSVRKWSGKPYSSKQIELFRFDKTDGIGIEKLYHSCYSKLPMVHSCLKTQTVSNDFLAKNDGLTLEEFKDWFKDYDLSQPMAIIHFTPFRYND